MHCRRVILLLIRVQSAKALLSTINYSSRYLCRPVIGRAASAGGFPLVETGQVQGCANNSSAVENSTELILVKYGMKKLDKKIWDKKNGIKIWDKTKYGIKNWDNKMG